MATNQIIDITQHTNIKRVKTFQRKAISILYFFSYRRRAVEIHYTAVRRQNKLTLISNTVLEERV